MDDDDGLVFNPQDSEEKQEDVWNTRDLSIFALDCTKEMFDKLYLEEPLFKCCLKCLKSVYMNKVIGQSNDLVGVIFYGTETADGNLEHITTFCAPKPADADIIKKLENMINSSTYCNFSSTYGHSNDYSVADILWKCSILMSKCSVKVRTKQIVLMTWNEDPHKNDSMKQHQTRKKAEDLRDLGISLELIPLRNNFKSDFYQEILKIANGQDIELFDTDRKVKELMERTYRKDVKKRSVAKLEWNIGNNVKLSVEMFNFYRRLNIPSVMKLDRKSNEPLKSVVQTYNTETGERLLKSDINRCVDVGEKRISFDIEEINKLRSCGKTGLTLLGFKSLAHLHPEYHFQDPSFIYPSDHIVKGSKQLFGALLQKCLEKQKFALCYLIARERSRSSLVALVPQAESCQENVQIMPPGFHVIFLPYADNIREIQLDEKLNLDSNHIALFKRILKKLSFKYSPQIIENPKVQTHWANIEALALDQEAREITDDTLCDYEHVSERLGQIEIDFCNKFFPENYDPETECNKKRKYPTSYQASKEKVPKFDPDDPSYVENMIKTNCAHKITVPVLKTFLLGKGIDVTGKKKTDLLNCLYEVFDMPPKN